MFQLRDYQKRAISQIIEAFKTANGVVLCAVLGSGKTVTACSYIIDCINKGEKVVWLVHRIELINQAAETFKKLGYTNFVVLQNVPKNNIDSPLVICGIQKLIRSESLLNNPTLVIVDEAHHAPSKKYLEAIERFKLARILGLSATPERDGMSKLFQTILHPVHVSEMIEQGVLVPIKIVGSDTRTRINFDDSVGGRSWEPVDYFLNYCAGTQTVIYTNERSHSKKIIEEFSKIGIAVVEIHGSTPKNERETILKDFKDRKINTIVNCSILSEGWDSDVDSIIITRACLDYKTFNQIAGRAMRKSRADKTHCTLVDLTGAYLDHGAPDSDQWYSIVTNSKKQPCLNCGADLERSDWLLKRSPNCEWCEKTEGLNPHCPHCNFHYEIPQMGRAEGLSKRGKKAFPPAIVELVDAILTRAPSMVKNERGISAALKKESSRSQALDWQSKNRAKDNDKVKEATYYALVALRSRINTKRRQRKLQPYRFGWIYCVYFGWYGEKPNPKWESDMKKYE